MRSGGSRRRRAGKAEKIASPPEEAESDEEREDEAAEEVRASPNEGLSGGEEEEDDDEGEGEGEEDSDGEEGPPKLADGFYEIEEIRKKRMRKGQIQFLIKWRGWPESANTWEPYDNVEPCADILEAFEERERAAGSTRKRRRKRRSSGSLSTIKRRRVGSSTSSRSRAKPRDLDAQSAEDDEEERFFSDEDDAAIPEEDKPSEQEGDPALGENDKPDAPEEVAGDVSVDLPLEEGKEPSKNESSPQQFTGARKRKSGRVRRFRQDAPENGAETATTQPAQDSAPAVAKARDGGLVKIIKAVAFAAAISNDAQKVSVTFIAQRSDGREVQVSNEFLRSNYPALLIDFYEQHLRFGS